MTRIQVAHAGKRIRRAEVLAPGAVLAGGAGRHGLDAASPCGRCRATPCSSSACCWSGSPASTSTCCRRWRAPHSRPPRSPTMRCSTPRSRSGCTCCPHSWPASASTSPPTCSSSTSPMPSGASPARRPRPRSASRARAPGEDAVTPRAAEALVERSHRAGRGLALGSSAGAAGGDHALSQREGAELHAAPLPDDGHLQPLGQPAPVCRGCCTG